MKLKLPDFNNPLVQIEMQIGFYWGILIGAVASAVMVLFFVDMAWYFKLTSAIGSICIIGVLSMSLYQLITQRRQYLEMQKIMGAQNEAALKTIGEKGVSYTG